MQWDKTSAVIDRLRAQTFRSLNTRNYRLYFIGQAISASGTWIQLVAENWLVIHLGGSGLVLGITTALQFTPLLLLSAYGGALVDRWNKRTLLICTQSASGGLALLIGLLTLMGCVQIWMVWIAAFLLGCVNALDNPGRQAFTMEMAGRNNVTNAVALNNAISTSARAIGPAIGSLIIATAGIAPCFLINAISYLAVVIALRMINSAELYTEATAPRGRGRIREGFFHVLAHPILRTALLIMLLVSTFGLNFQVLLPLLASRTFHQGGALYGLFMSCLGIGSVAGSLIVANWSNPTIRRVAMMSFIFGVSLAIVAIIPTLQLSFPAIAIMGLASSLFLASCSSCLQINAGESMHGRVMSFYYVVFLGVAPIGGPLVGAIAQVMGPRIGFLTGAIACILASGLFFLMRSQATHNTGDEKAA